MNIHRILCVCTGNICRSPLAEGWLRRELPSVTTTSAGVGAVEGGRMPDAAARIAMREGLDLESHRGRQITRPMIQAHDLVLVMEQGQKQWLVGRFPEAQGRTFLATHWTTGADIRDPYRLDEAVFEQVYAELVDALQAWKSRLAPIKYNNSRTG